MWAITILSSREPERDLVEQDRAGLSSEPAREKVVPWWISIGSSSRSSASQTREELGPERVDVLVDRPELAADETEVALHPLELVDAPVSEAGSTEPKPTSRAGSRATYDAT